MNMIGQIRYACGCTDSWAGTDQDRLPNAGEQHYCPTHGGTTIVRAQRVSK